jgi:hypothetical protein
MDVRVSYVSIDPASEPVAKAVFSNSDVVVLGGYDSGKMPAYLFDCIRDAKRRGTPVFGIKQTIPKLKECNILELGKYSFRDHVLQPEALYVGYVPLEGYPLPLVKLAVDVRSAVDQTQYSPKIFSVGFDGAAYLDELLEGIKEVFVQHESFKDRVDAVRERFSTPQFNRFLDEEIERAFLIYGS